MWSAAYPTTNTAPPPVLLCHPTDEEVEEARNHRIQATQQNNYYKYRGSEYSSYLYTSSYSGGYYVGHAAACGVITFLFFIVSIFSYISYKDSMKWLKDSNTLGIDIVSGRNPNDPGESNAYEEVGNKVTTVVAVNPEPVSPPPPQSQQPYYQGDEVVNPPPPKYTPRADPPPPEAHEPLQIQAVKMPEP
ncbi:hypothetical protein GGI12_000458 [Dipsacomyces acuminosporus]|nr:hypothetical protein GGI12_000458 [Dipsacomyces acuminosporus]